ncbi:MAG: trimethylamine methyltransferase family protein, partial [Nitrososphaerota archaeon]
MNKFDFSNIKSKLQLLTKEDIEKIHSSAIKILEKTGIMFDNKEALKIFNENGFEVNFEKKIVKINEEAIKEAIIKAPSKIIIYDRNGKECLFLEENNVYYNPGSAAINILDIETNNIRKPTSKDLEKFSILVDSLSYIHAQSTALIVSDVPGNDLSIIASGPTVKDLSTKDDALKIIKKYDLSVKKRDLIETPKEDKYFENVENKLILSNLTALKAMKEKAEELGFTGKILSDNLKGEVRDVARKLLKKIQNSKEKILLFGGETTVKVKGKGKGGRNL